MSPTKKSKGAPPPADLLIPKDVADESRLAGWGPTLLHWRTMKKLEQRDLAKLIKRSQVTISAWENGTRLPKWGDIKKIAETCDVDLSDDIPASLLSLSSEEQALIRQLVQALASGNEDVRTIILPALRGVLRRRE